MIVYFADRRMNILGQASTKLPGGHVITDDEKVEEIEVGVATFSFYLPFTEADRLEMERWIEAGNYILRKHNEEAEFYTIIETEVDTEKGEAYVYAEDAGLDLLNEVVGAYEADQAYPAAYYIEKFAYDSGFEVGINEISDLRRKLKWEGEQTATGRILSIATQFDNAEISYSFEVKNLSVVHKYINIYKSRGKDSGAELRLNRDISRIITKKSVANLATAFIVTGGTPEGQDHPITLNGYQYDDGDFHVEGGMLKSRKALAKWSRYLSEKGSDVGHIVQTYSYDTKSQSELCNRAISQLKKVCDTEINFEVDIAILPPGVRIGDTVSVVDDAGNLYLSARVLKLETSAADDTAKATLGDYLIRGSGISQKLEELATQFSELAKSRVLYTWIAYADDAQGTGITLEPAGKAYMGTAANKLAEQPDLSEASVFSWALIKGDDGKDGEDGKDGDKGADGKPSFTHIAYANSSDGTTDFSVSDSNREYIGMYVDQHETDSTDPTKYAWTKIKGDKGDTGATGGQGIQGPAGKDGTVYYTWIKYADSPTAGMSDNPSGKKYMGIAYNKTSAAMSTNYSDYNWALFMGPQGVAGTPGANGQPTYTWIKYATSAAGAGMSDDPAGKTYIGLAYNKSTQTESNVASDYTWALMKGDKGDTGATGNTGAQGPAGKGIQSSVVTYQASTSGTAVPTGSWTITIPSVAANQFLWTRTIFTFTDSTTSIAYSVGKMGANGTNGANGATGATGPQGPAGKGISSTTITYQASASGTTVPTGTWTTTIPSVAANQYLWTRIILKYTDSSTATSYTIGKMGANGANGAKGDSGIIVSATAPASPATGQLWQSAAGQPIKRWTGSAWVIHYLSVENLSVQALSALSANLGTVTAGIIKNKDETLVFDVANGSITSFDDYYLATTKLSAGYLSVRGKDQGTIPVETVIRQDSILCQHVAGATGSTLLKFTPQSDSWSGDVEINGKPILEALIPPIGWIEMTAINVNPSQRYKGTTWVAWGSGRVPVGVNTADSSFNTPEKTGGAKTHALITGELPSHNHVYRINIQHGDGPIVSNTEALQSGLQVNGRRRYADATENSGSGQAHNNLQPYITCYMWKRTG